MNFRKVRNRNESSRTGSFLKLEAWIRSTPSAPCEKSRAWGSGGSLVARPKVGGMGAQSALRPAPRGLDQRPGREETQVSAEQTQGPCPPASDATERREGLQTWTAEFYFNVGIGRNRQRACKHDRAACFSVDPTVCSRIRSASPEPPSPPCRRCPHRAASPQWPRRAPEPHRAPARPLSKTPVSIRVPRL